MNSTVKSSLVTPPIKICSAESRDASPTVALPSGGSELSPMPVWRVCRDRSERHSYRAGFLLARQEEPRVVSKPISVEGDGRATRYTRASHPRSEAISAQRDGQFSNHSSNTPPAPLGQAPKTRIRWSTKPVYLLIVCGFTQGCADVAPWERGNLAKPEMAITPNPSQNHFRDHVYTSKEASQGGHGGNGGGCGCN